MAAKPLPSQAYLRQRLEYDERTGAMTWRRRPVSDFNARNPERGAKTWNSRFAGKAAFTALTTGYRYGAIDYTLYLAHRVIWKMVHGEEPDEIDHINGNRADNRLENLRAVTGAENHRNMSRPRNNTSGVCGVSRANASSWEAYIHRADRKIGLGYFRSFDEAVAARKAAEVAYDYHPNHGRP